MARVVIHDIDHEITDPVQICEFLAPYGIWYEKWEVQERVDPEAESETILAAYAEEIDRLKQRGGFVTADVISVSPATPGLDEMMSKFAQEHTHSEDEVRFTIAGRGRFQIHPGDGPVFAIEVEQGDLINVPCGTRHWFHLCENQTIRCIRLFEDKAGWTPHYVDDPLHAQYAPACLGPAYIQSTTSRRMDSVIDLP